MVLSNTPNRAKGIVFALISSAIFGLAPLFSIPLLKEGHIPEFSILFYRYFFSTIVLGLWCLFRRKSLKINLRQFFTLLILSIVFASAAIGLIHSYRYVTSGIATTIHFFYPIIVMVLMILCFKEHKSLILFLAASISLIGVGFLSWTNVGFINTKGLLIALSTVFTYSFYIVGLDKSDTNKMEPEVVTFYIVLFGFIFFSFISLFTGEIDSLNKTRYLLDALWLALFPTVVANITLVVAIKNAGAIRSSILGSLEPAVVVLVSTIGFSGSSGWYSDIGFLMIIVSVILVVFGDNWFQQMAKKTNIRRRTGIKPFHHSHH